MRSFNKRYMQVMLKSSDSSYLSLSIKELILIPFAPKMSRRHIYHVTEFLSHLGSLFCLEKKCLDFVVLLTCDKNVPKSCIKRTFTSGVVCHLFISAIYIIHLAYHLNRFGRFIVETVYLY